MYILPILLLMSSAGPSWSLSAEFADARGAVAGFQQSRRQRRDAVLDSWIVGGGLFDEDDEKAAVRCEGGPCTDERKEAVLDTLAGWLGRMPAFLKKAKLSNVYWHDRPEGARRNGEKDGHAVSLWVPEGARMDDILVHEISHIYHSVEPETVSRFLALRFKTEEFGKKMGELWLHIMRINNGSMAEPVRLDAKARMMLAGMKAPRRHPNDVHALVSESEYWAVSVELAYLASRRGEWDGLGSRLSESEISYLRRLFEQSVPPPPAS